MKVHSFFSSFICVLSRNNKTRTKKKELCLWRGEKGVVESLCREANTSLLFCSLTFYTTALDATGQRRTADADDPNLMVPSLGLPSRKLRSWSCGTCNTSQGETCTNGVCQPLSCTPVTSCTAEGRNCGEVAVGSGCKNETCGTCTGNDACVNGVCSCTPTSTCGTNTCGQFDLGCGLTSCGTCPGGSCVQNGNTFQCSTATTAATTGPPQSTGDNVVNAASAMEPSSLVFLALMAAGATLFLA
jgi:hypothetical protein